LELLGTRYEACNSTAGRPLAEYGRLTVRKPAKSDSGKRANWTTAPLTLEDLDAATTRARERLAKSPAFVADLEQLGRERALIYKSLVLDRDLATAGIPKRDERGRSVDVHALRHTFGTLLSKGGVTPRTAQAAMRHSTINLTMNTYTDPKLLDVAGAMEALPAIPLDGGPDRERIATKATGTNDYRPSEFAPKFAPTPDKPCKSWSIPDNSAAIRGDRGTAGPIAVTACPDKRKDPLTTSVNGSSRWAMRDSDPRPSRCKRDALTN
jgi:hypothetical protein